MRKTFRLMVVKKNLALFIFIFIAILAMQVIIEHVPVQLCGTQQDFQVYSEPCFSATLQLCVPFETLLT